MFQVYPRVMTFFGNRGQLLAGGELRFFELDTTTPKPVYADPDLTDTNGNIVGLDASARPNEGLYGSGNYFVELYDAAGVKQGEDRAYAPGGASQSIPIPMPGEFLTGDGTQILAQAIRQLPDPTGYAGKFLGTDGDAFIWQAGPVAPTLPTLPTSSSTTMRIGDYMLQLGTGSAAPTGSHTASVAVTYPIAFSAAETPKVFVVPTVSNASVGGFVPTPTITGASSTEFTVKFDTNEGGSAGNLTNAVTFNWIAFGRVAPE